jgi:hypothetical protein
MIIVASYTATAAAILVSEESVEAQQNPHTFDRFDPQYYHSIHSTTFRSTILPLTMSFDRFLSPKFKACVLDGSAYSSFLLNHRKYRYSSV